jgi:hypothetical protein
MKQIGTAKQAISFFGDRIGLWQRRELELLLAENINKSFRLSQLFFPILTNPELPPWVNSFQILDLRNNRTDLYEQLIATVGSSS